MAFLKDITDKIILGRWRFLNLKTISGTTKPLVVDEQGNLGTGSGETAPTTAEVSNALKAKAEIAALSETSTLADIVAALKA